MKYQRSSKSGLFLIELILGIFFFSVCATICAQIFVKSHTLSKKSVDLTHAVSFSQSLAEEFTASPSFEYINPHLNSEYEGLWARVEVLNASFDDSLLICNINCYIEDDSEPIYTLEAIALYP